MEQSLSTSKVTVEYFDPHNVYKLLAPGLIPRLPLRNLHWQSHAGPLRSIETLHIELIDALAAAKAPRQRAISAVQPPGPGGAGDDGFQTQPLGGGNRTPGELQDGFSRPYTASARRHQIPGLRQTPYLKVLLVRCDDNDQYKSKVRSEVRDWIKEHTTTQSSHNSKKDAHHNAAENHDACEWLIIHVVVPNTVAATQPRTTGSGSGKGADGSSDSLPITKSTGSLWSKTTTPLLEKLRSDFTSSSKGNVDRITQIRIGVNDVPYDILPRVVPAVPTGYSETEEDAKAAWAELIDRFKRLILSSFDLRVTQYEEDIKEKDAQRSLPGWNFCTFFILKEGLARGFESVGLVEDALVGYDELSVGLDAIIQEQAAADFAETHGGSLLPFTPDLKRVAQKAMATASTGTLEFEDEETVDLQVKEQEPAEKFDDIPISVMKKPYRDLILANNVSIFDFRCYIFARQIALLLRLGNAWSTREELLHKLREQQESVLHGVAPRAPPPTQTDESENLSMLAEICKRTLEFIPAVSQVMRRDLIAALMDQRKLEAGGETPVTSTPYDNLVAEVAENVVASFAFSIAQQILAQTSTKGLSVPSTTTSPTAGEASEPQSRDSISERPTMFPTRTSSLRVSTLGESRLPALPSPNFFPGPGDRRASMPDMQDTINQQHHKAGQEELAARRAELYALSRNILEECGKKRGWSDGWSSAPEIGETGLQDMEDVDLDDDGPSTTSASAGNVPAKKDTEYSLAGVDNKLLRTALDNREDFYRLYEMLTDKALRHYTVANHTHSVLAAMSDLAVMKYYLEDYAAAASYFLRTTPFYGESGWSLLELSMLVMYSKCLRELKKNDDYVRVVLKLLSKAANSEKERIQETSSIKLGQIVDKEYPESEAFKGFLPDFLVAAKSFNKDVKHSLLNFFTNIELEGTPVYDDGQDSFCLTLRLRSVLADPLPVDKAMVRLVAAGGSREIWLENTEDLELKPGRNKIQLRSNAMSPGMWEVDRVQLNSGPLRLSFERKAFQPFDHKAVNLRNPFVVLYQRAETLDLQVEPATVVQLDQNFAMDLELTTGWNEVQTCEIRIRSATGGLRLLTAEAKILDGEQQQKPTAPEPGLFSFSSMAAGSSVKIRIPFTTEQDVPSVSAKVEIKFTTDKGTFTLSKTPSISLALKLGVNVQDVFKHTALFSRFTVSSASQSPLRLFKSELVESDVFESRFGVPPANPVVIFPKQPASLLYQIKRKPGSKIGPNTQKTMYLNLFYSVLQDEIRDNVRDSLTAALKDANLWQYSRLVIASVLEQVRSDLTPYDLERSAMLGVLPTGFLAEVMWQKQFYGLGSTAKGEDVATLLTDFILGWTKKNAKIPAMRTVEASQQQSIIIPVDIPSIPVVHTADIRLQRPIPSLVQPAYDYEAPVACINQLLAATLHLKWTRVWDTGRLDTQSGGTSEETIGDEFTYEVMAPSDTWLVGGRRKGHFVIPASSPSTTETELSSSPINEADIPLMLIPLREGYLPYPSVEVREAGSENEDRTGPGVGHCETDYRNLGETVRVVADRGRVTVSLDASGLGGGPLVLESERVLGRELGRIVI
ncbi:Trafficking protein particle complex subunit 10 [Cytospora mali]|uniref:Trafficking protein particle complex subunit 10 n=1 Tax=Cytospora mali TaxID=578113 RepID=A0A194V1I1_CYTMA|nr:Trafficking protein particle complex subunit 10 [Valsa mali var. pyri (nom. inval.)]